MSAGAGLFEGEVAIENPGAPLVLRAPLRICCVGSSGSGKTSALLRCVVLAEPSPFAIVFWCAPAESLRQVKLQNAKAILDQRAEERGLTAGLITLETTDDGIPTEELDRLIDQAFEEGLPSLVVFDDLLYAKKGDQLYIANLYVNGRHRLASVAECRQRIFSGAAARDTRLQCNAFILADFGQKDEVARLASQICADKKQAAQMVDFYGRATSKKYGFLLVDLQNPPPWRFRDSSLERGFR